MTSTEGHSLRTAGNKAAPNGLELVFCLGSGARLSRMAWNASPPKISYLHWPPEHKALYIRESFTIMNGKRGQNNYTILTTFCYIFNFLDNGWSWYITNILIFYCRVYLCWVSNISNFWLWQLYYTKKIFLLTLHSSVPYRNPIGDESLNPFSTIARQAMAFRFAGGKIWPRHV